MLTRWMVATSILLALGSTQKPQEQYPKPTVSADFLRAFANNQASVLAALYADDATLLPENQPAVTGRKSIEQWYHRLFASGASKLKMESVRSVREGALAYETAIYVVVSAAGDSSEPVEQRHIWTLRRSPAGWLIDSHMFNSDAPKVHGK